jgi:hypothetical protein
MATTDEQLARLLDRVESYQTMLAVPLFGEIVHRVANQALQEDSNTERDPDTTIDSEQCSIYVQRIAGFMDARKNGKPVGAIDYQMTAYGLSRLLDAGAPDLPAIDRQHWFEATWQELDFPAY